MSRGLRHVLVGHRIPTWNPTRRALTVLEAYAGISRNPVGELFGCSGYGTPRKTQAPQPKTESTTRANAGLVDANAILRWPEGTLIGWVF